jgi:hypothetical protein
MKYYKTKENIIRAIGEEGDIDGDQSFLVQDDWTEITKEEVEAITNPPLTEEQKLQLCINQRQTAYKVESDPLYLEAIYDNDDSKMQDWRDKVQEIKERYPKP